MSREFEFTDKHFQQIRKLVLEHTGIHLSDIKMDMVYSRLARRLRQLHLNSFTDYLELLAQGDDGELGNFVNSITTNLTSFFREQHHFEYLKATVLPQLMRLNAASKTIRIWSAGCSSGEEPYSLAITVKEAIPDKLGWDVRILATDLDTNVIATGSEGVYTLERVNGLPPAVLKRWFYRGTGERAGLVKASSALRDLIIFKQLNLMGDWPVKAGVDVIFCRNVVIYFDKDTQRRLFHRYADILRSDGYLFVGHSETLYKVSERFRLLGKTVYQRMA
ncbi:chemotaxis protein CheR [Candidatus Tenderia electrophaga]|jgi:chemotaxis protein methyltransferase CheR|uniref:Chemotaxis protein methyltransferase n=1 Tax=Candidatus Tenderia electrophaga TaxID=1748243 RepID=A0A0S2TC20_9GAMM|nr:chemotaxis protein CheR [Candidatus Tenderia electrophaga]